MTDYIIYVVFLIHMMRIHSYIHKQKYSISSHTCSQVMMLPVLILFVGRSVSGNQDKV